MDSIMLGDLNESSRVEGTVSVGNFYAFTDRGRKPNGLGQYYWRVRERGRVGTNVWTGRATPDEINARLVALTKEDSMNNVAIAVKKVEEVIQASTPAEYTRVDRRSLKVGVVSTVEHIKTLTRGLKQMGHTVVPLPELGNKSTIPSTVDVVICRVQGTSHRASSICIQEARKNVRPVIFRNGTTSALLEVQKVMDGTWQPDARSMEEMNQDPEETCLPPEAGVEEEPARREDVESTTRAHILQVIEKGAIFSRSLTETANCERAKNVLCKVSHPEKDRVKRTAVVEALRKIVAKAEVIDQQVELLAGEGKPNHTVYRVRTSAEHPVIEKEVVLSAQPLTAQQVNEYVQALNAQGKRVKYAVNQEELAPQPVVPVEIEPEPVLPVVVPVVVEVAQTIPVQPSTPSPSTPISESAEKEVGDYLEMVAQALDSLRIKHIDAEMLAKYGLCLENGGLALNIVHMASPAGACCGGASTRVAFKSAAVTCKTCRATDIFKYMEWHESTAR